MQIPTALALLALSLLPEPAAAESSYATIADIASKCRAVDESRGAQFDALRPVEQLRVLTAANACVGFLNGAMQMHTAMALVTPNSRLFFPPEFYTIENVRRIVLLAVNRRPEYASEEAMIGVLFALDEAFPCPGRSKIFQNRSNR